MINWEEKNLIWEEKNKDRKEYYYLYSEPFPGYEYMIYENKEEGEETKCVLEVYYNPVLFFEKVYNTKEEAINKANEINNVLKEGVYIDDEL